MTKYELIQQLQKKCHLSNQESSKIVEIFFNEMIKAFVNGERVEKIIPKEFLYEACKSMKF